MTIQSPNIVPVGYSNDYTDFLKAKCERDGAVRSNKNLVSVPSGTVSGQTVGLIPFRAGARLSYGSSVISAALGTSVTLALGYLYNDTTQPNSGTSQAAGFGAASSAAAAGGVIPITATTSMMWVAASDGWIIATIGGATTTSTGNINFDLLINYDQSGITTITY